MGANIRKIALELLLSYEREQRYVNLLLSTPSVTSLSREDRAALTVLLYTTVEKKLTYDYLIGAFAERSVDSIDEYVREALRLGLCQVLDMRSIPTYAAVNETVKLARHKGEANFINAVLRRAVKSKDSLPLPERGKNLARYLSIYYSVPLSTVKMLSRIFGAEGAESFLQASKSSAELSLTVNEMKISRDELRSKLSESGAVSSPYTDNGIVIKDGASVRELQGFAEGEFFVQDESSRIATHALGASEGEFVIDVCAAPGGKTLGAAIKVGKGGKILSFDLHESKLSLIEDSAMRLGLTNVEARALDATTPDETLFGTADRVICDVPCSGLGVLSKKPDLRYKDISEIDSLPPLQYSILEASAKYLKAGGVITYSTCTVNPSENEEITDRFISEHPEFSYEEFSIPALGFLGAKLNLLPHIHGTDGFYIAKMRKNK